MSLESTADQFIPKSPSGVRRKQIISNKVFGMIICVFTEIMFFTALISAFLVIRGDQSSWEVPNGVRLPILATAYNTGVLFLSGALLMLAGKKLKANNHLLSKTLLGWACMLGAFFVAFQGYEWVQLISYGFTMKAGIFSACFFLVIGSHAVHALAGVLALAYVFLISKEKIDIENLRTVQIFWFFVVGIWPILYGLVYF